MKRTLYREISRFSRVAMREKALEVSAKFKMVERGHELSKILAMMQELDDEVESLRQESSNSLPSGSDLFLSAAALAKLLSYSHSCFAAAEQRVNQLKIMDSMKHRCRNEITGLARLGARHSKRGELCDSRVLKAKRTIVAGRQSLEHTEVEEQFGYRSGAGVPANNLIPLTATAALFIAPATAWAQNAITDPDPLGGPQIVRTVLALLFVCALAMTTLHLYAKRFGKRSPSVTEGSSKLVIRERLQLDSQSELIVVNWVGVGELLIVRDARGSQVVAQKGESGEVINSAEGLTSGAAFLDLIEAVVPRKVVPPTDAH